MSDRPSLFISRKLSSSSPLLSSLGEHFDIIGQSLLDFTSVPFEVDLSTCTWVFFYSSNAVRFFFKGYTEPISALKMACVGPKTAQTLQEEFGYKAAFIGDGRPENTGTLFKNQLTEEDIVLFPRAQHSRKSIQEMLPLEQQKDLVVYNNTLKEYVDLPKSKYSIFTSPLNVKAYLRMGHTMVDSVIIAIGETTRHYLFEKTGIMAVTPESASEESIRDLILTMEEV